MLPETRKAFESGRGKELGEKDLPGKMQALYSSSALVVNFFEYWMRSARIPEVVRTPEMAAGLEDHIRTIEEIVKLINME